MNGWNRHNFILWECGQYSESRVSESQILVVLELLIHVPEQDYKNK